MFKDLGMRCRCHTLDTTPDLIPHTLPAELLYDFVQGFVDVKISCPTYAVVRTIWAILERSLAGLKLCANMFLQPGSSDESSCYCRQNCGQQQSSTWDTFQPKLPIGLAPHQHTAAPSSEHHGPRYL